MTERPERYVLVFPNERTARSFQFAVDGAIGNPRAGTRVGRGHHGPRRTDGTITHAGIRPGPSGVWLCDVYAGNEALGWRTPLGTFTDDEKLVNLANRERPRPALDVKADGVHWVHLAGFFREYLEDFLTGVPFDVVSLHATAAPDGKWKCKALSLEFEESYEIETTELFDLLRSAEIEASWITWPIAVAELEPDLVRLHYLRIRRDYWERQPRLQGRDDLVALFDCFFGAYVFTLLTYIAIDAAHGGPLPLGYDEFRSTKIRTNAARSFVSTICSPFCREPRSFHLFDSLCGVSELPYERRPAVGAIMFCDVADAGWVDWVAKLNDPVPIVEAKRIRKLLETCAGNSYLISDSVQVFGIGRIADPGLRHYFAKFDGAGRWSFHDGNDLVLMDVRQRRAGVPAELVDYETLRQHVERCIKTLSSGATQALFSVVVGAVLQRHGTTVVVSTDTEEVTRLAKGGFVMDPRRLTRGDTESLTSVDCALLLNDQAQCCAFGVILDGSANNVSTVAARGARYNSALRYVKEQRRLGKDCLAVVVSEDGGIDLLPELADDATEPLANGGHPVADVGGAAGAP